MIRMTNGASSAYREQLGAVEIRLSTTSEPPTFPGARFCIRNSACRLRELHHQESLLSLRLG